MLFNINNLNMKFKSILLITILSIYTIKAEVVCSEDELVKEIIEDLADNGIIY